MKDCPTFKPILVIDDEISILKLLTTSLTRKGYTVDTAASGKEGIQKIDTHEYSLILTDIKMPDISGDQILTHLRKKSNESIPIVGMSGTPWLLEGHEFDAVLEKPYQIKEMLELVQKLTSPSG